MSGGLLDALFPRMRRAALVLLSTALVVVATAFPALKFGLLTAERAGGFLALAIILFACGAVLLVLGLIGRNMRGT